MRFKLLVGIHEEVDRSIERRMVEDSFLDPDTGEPKTKKRLETPGEWMLRAKKLYCAAPAKERVEKDYGIITHGDVIESDRDLCQLNGDRNCDPKFERIVEGHSVDDGLLHQSAGESVDAFIARIQASKLAKAQGTQPITTAQIATAIDTDDTYNEMTVEELRRHAADEEIDLGAASKKADIVRIIRDWERQLEVKTAPHG
jgi:hypothetical protein